MAQYFEWDEQKAENNFKKHGIRFKAATQIFDDPFAVSFQDRVEDGEERWQTIGMSDACLLLMVAHTFRDAEGGDVIVRIISARKVNRLERSCYEHGQI